jgi:hypothetical protein
VNPQRLLYWAPRLFLGVGVLIFVVGAVIGVFAYRFIAGSEEADGTVIDLKESYDSQDDTTVYYPIVRFTTAEGRTVEFESNVSSSHDVGDRVEVLYDPDDPTDARLSGFFNLWFGSLAFGAVGIGFVAIGAYIVRRTRTPSKEDVEWLRRHGRRVQGRRPRAVEGDVVVTEVSPYRIEVDVHEPMRGGPRVLASEYVWLDPTPFLKDRDTVDVYIHPEEPERYFVDISFLPKSEPESVRLAP